MKKIKILSILLSMVAAILTTGCGGNVFGEKISEGVITYKLEYPDGENNNSLVMMLPPQMTMAFKNNNTSMLIKGFAGCFVLRYIGDYSQQQNNTLLSVGFDKKYWLVTEFGEPPFGTKSMSDIKITQTSDTTSICGYLCHKAIGHSDKCNRDFTFWYTNDIDIEGEGILSPIKTVGGVLMEFDVDMIGIYMKVRAIEVNRQKVSDDEFAIPDGYKQISQQELEGVIHTFDGSKHHSN